MPASASIFVTNLSKDSFKVNILRPKFIEPGKELLIIAEGISGFKSENLRIEIDNQRVVVDRMIGDSIFVVAPLKIHNGKIEITHEYGYAQIDSILISREKILASLSDQYIGPYFLSGDAHSLCRGFYETVPNDAVIHSGVDELILGSTTDHLWCLNCPLSACTFSYTVSDENILRVSPRFVTSYFGIYGWYLTYDAVGEGLATVTGNTGSTHTVEVIAPEENNDPDPPTRAPRSEWQNVVDGRRYYIEDGPFTVSTRWTVGESALGAQVRLIVPEYLSIISSNTVSIGNGETVVDFMLRINEPGDNYGSTRIYAQATNNIG